MEDPISDGFAPAWPDPEEWMELQLSSEQARCERLRAEAEQLRTARDQQAARVGELQARVEELTSRVSATESAMRRSRRQLARARARIDALENSRALRLARLVKRLPARITARLRRSGSDTGAPGPARDSVDPADPPHALTHVVIGTQRIPVDGRAATTFSAVRGLPIDENATACAGRAGAELRRKLVEAGPRPLRVVGILDEFTARSLAPDCDLVQLHPDSWRAEIDAHDPDLLLVESAWRGDGGTWHNVLPSVPEALEDILRTCRERNVPTVFWNKEDPVHFASFLRLASKFDHVFTTDADCLPRYRDALGHGRVHLLPFACQPRLQNPIEGRQRLNALAFAGGYYTRYPERTRDLRSLLTGAASVMPVHIWDRELGTTLEEYQFPAEYQRFIVGTLAPGNIDVAYKGYRFALNLNSVKHSQSMFARRAYELLSSGTVTVSNYARGARVMLGDLLVMSDSEAATAAHLRRLRDDTWAYDRLRLQGLRKVHSEHTYADRLRYVVSRITGDPYDVRERQVTALAPARTTDEIRRIVDVLSSQRGVTVRTIVVTDDESARRAAADAGARVLATTDVADVDGGELVAGTEGLALIHPDDWYGPTYLLDLVLAWEYTDADVVGRLAFAAADFGSVSHEHPGTAYRPCSDLDPRRSIVAAHACGAVALVDLLANVPSVLTGLTQFTIDRFDYCRGGHDLPADVLTPWTGTEVDDDGVSSTELFAFLDQELPSWPSRRETPVLDPAVLAAIPPTLELGVRDIRRGIRFESTATRDLPDYRWLNRALPLPPGQESFTFHLDLDGDLDLMLGGRFFSATGSALASFTGRAHRNVTVDVPPGAAALALAIRSAGTGVSVVHSLFLDAVPLDPPTRPTRTDVLVVTDQYPAYDDLYRNAFLHTRVRGYRRAGVSADVFRVRRGERLTYAEFEGVEVATGSYEALAHQLRTGSYDAVFVHFLDARLWRALEPFAATHQIVVWVHGQDIQPLSRRRFELLEPTADERERADERTAFWRSLALRDQDAVTFVFVSAGFFAEVQQDYDGAFDAARVEVIHNPVDADLFRYAPKDEGLRTKILSVRSYASRKYANDLAVAAVLKLSREPWFGELEFCFVGDGPLFDEALRPLADVSNVTVRRGFLSQRELADLQEDYGVFLTPSRWDSQGVSRDEAMAAGLVPITHDVGAIREFVSDAEGYLLPEGDVDGIVEALRELYLRPEVFRAKSAAAAARVRRQTTADVVIPAEISLLRRP